MKRTVLKGSVFFVVFLTSLFVVSRIMNQGNTDMTAEMPPPSFPMVTMLLGGEQVNTMHGYAREMDVSSQRDCIMPIMSDRKLTLEIEPFGNKIEQVSFQLRNVKGSRLIEDTKIYNYVEQDGKIKVSLTIKDLIEKEEEYSFMLLLQTEEGKDIRFYSRIVQGDEYYAKEKIEFAKDFHNKTFDKTAAKEIAKYLESNSDGDNTVFHTVDIHSSFSQITWGDLNPQQIGEVEVKIKELGKQTAGIELRYDVVVSEGKKTKEYSIIEYYHIRYGKDRMYLLDFERNMSQKLIADEHVFTGNKIELGIVNPDIHLMESDGGSAVAFVLNNSLYSYYAADQKFVNLFSFSEPGKSDIRSDYNASDIKILSVDEAGNIRFMVYGYMNRGRHEGNVGIQVYYFNAALNTIEEELFLPVTNSFEILKSDVKQLSYVSKNNIFYVLLNADVYSIDLMSQFSDIVVSDLTEEDVQVSDSGKMIVWQKGDTTSGSGELVLMNLNTRKKTTIQAESGQRIKPLGFLEEDLIYGLARETDIMEDAAGRILFPMYQLQIQSEQGEILETYRKDNIYVESCEIKSNQITLKCLSKEGEEGQFVSVEDGKIMNNEVTEQGINTIETVAIDKYQKIVQIAVKNTVNINAIKIRTPKEVLYEGDRQLILSNKEDVIDRYYVYGKKGIEASFNEPRKAIEVADSISGVVVNREGEYVWVKGNRVARNQIMAIREQAVTEEKGSVSVCLDTILKYEGVLRNTEYMLSQGQGALGILRDNMENAEVLDLTGCSLDSVLYYVNRDIPVLAMLKSGDAVLLIGFNELNTVIMDPLTGKIEKKGLNDSVKMFEENGNTFITYIPSED